MRVARGVPRNSWGSGAFLACGVVVGDFAVGAFGRRDLGQGVGR